MDKEKKRLLKLLFTALLMAAGIVLVLFASIHYVNYYPLLTILLIAMAIFFPTLCGGCQVAASGNANLLLDTEDYDLGPRLAWVLTGFFVITGYSLSIELFRGKYIPAMAVYLSLGGDTIIMAAALIFVKIIYYTGDSSNAFLL